MKKNLAYIEFGIIYDLGHLWEILDESPVDNGGYST
jgi:hypothetical protein